MKYLRFLLCLVFLLACLPLKVVGDNVTRCPEFSTAGFFALEGTGREVFSMNPAWRFMKGDEEDAYRANFDDSSWDVVSLPHGIEYLPTEASGCINYQGVVWYRKHFSPDVAWKGKKLMLHFEAIMGKSKVFVNGKLVAEHFGGYLPVVIDISDAFQFGQENVIAVCADNSNDPSYPPGKAQEVLDYTYFGGIYRDCWLVVHNDLYITDANKEDEVAGGGLFVSCSNVSDKSADILLKTHLRNETGRPFKGRVEYLLFRPDGTRAARATKSFRMEAASALSVQSVVALKSPLLWTPKSPTLYNLHVLIKDTKGKVVDGFRQRLGVRSIEFRGKDGFYLNDKPYDHPLIGANRHQDFAVIGNAVPNSIHWRDAYKLRDAGMEVIRNAHCPQDPAFMDACDELGLLVIDNTPGWQFWNNDPVFAQRVYSDIRNLVRRDRNHACLWLWEPILNETHYPTDFAEKAIHTVSEECPGAYSASDIHAQGAEFFPVQFTHPKNTMDARGKQNDSTKTYFTREWGDNVDNWRSHNSNSRVARSWGEEPMLVQARHYASPAYSATSYDVLYRQERQHVGGCLWHSFDHQRGYHPDPFYGGVMDVFRQPKYSYYLFMAQRPLGNLTDVGRLVGEGPMVFIAHEMTPFSGKDVDVYSNCEEVRLTINKGGKTYTLRKDSLRKGMPSPIFTFADAYDFMEGKDITYHRGSEEDVYMLAEGIVDGEVVATHKVSPARRPEQIILQVDDEGTPLRADGSDCVVVVASVCDRYGNVKRLNNDFISFEIEGEGRLLGDASVMANPAHVRWGTAPVIVQSTTTAGKITVRANILYSGSQKPVSAEITLRSIPSEHTLIFSDEELKQIKSYCSSPSARFNNISPRAFLDDASIKEVEEQQKAFGE